MRFRGLFGRRLALLCVVAGWALCGRDAAAQDATPAPTGATTSRPDAFWHCQLPGGDYLVALRSIASISTHEYIVDAAARVTEVTVATNSSVEARFYYLEPIAASAVGGLGATAALEALQQHVLDTATAATGAEPIWEKVVKNYPTSTHAHTVEYRLTSKGNLQQLYSSLQQSWTSGKGANLTTQ